MDGRTAPSRRANASAVAIVCIEIEAGAIPETCSARAGNSSRRRALLECDQGPQRVSIGGGRYGEGQRSAQTPPPPDSGSTPFDSSRSVAQLIDATWLRRWRLSAICGRLCDNHDASGAFPSLTVADNLSAPDVPDNSDNNLPQLSATTPSSGTRRAGGKIIKSAEARVVPLSIPKSPTIAIYWSSIGCVPKRRLQRPAGKVLIMRLGLSPRLRRRSKQRRSDYYKSGCKNR
jgi:hypothetical protein